MSGFPATKFNLPGRGFIREGAIADIVVFNQYTVTEVSSYEDPRRTPIGLDVVIWAPVGMDPWDATNYLGGIADVLEYKTGRGAAVEHLGDLADVWLYRNDRQIKRVSYREEARP